MARKTKEDALATRTRLLDAAERVFYERGVSRTSLSDIAQEAGTTRGAIYWHFKDKADLFDAMMKRVTLPMERALVDLENEVTLDPINLIRSTIMRCVNDVAHDEHTRRVFDIATHKVEYVGDLLSLKSRHAEGCSLFIGTLESLLNRAAQLQGRTLNMPVADAARGLHGLLGGIANDWYITDGSFDLVKLSEQALDCFIQGLGLELPAPQAVDHLFPAPKCSRALE